MFEEQDEDGLLRHKAPLNPAHLVQVFFSGGAVLDVFALTSRLILEPGHSIDLKVSNSV